MDTTEGQGTGFDTGAAVTRSLLGWGVVAGPFYLVLGLVLALTRPGFDLTRHALSLLMLGPLGWIQTVNLILSGVMVLAAALGFARALRPTSPRAGTAAGVLLATYGVALIGSGIFPPDPVGGFPPGQESAGGSVSGVLHLAFGAVGFVALSAAAVVVGGWFAGRGRRDLAWLSRVAAAVVVVGFVGGAALALFPVGVGLLWLAVVAGWAWLAVASVQAYRVVPHPVLARRS